MIALIVGTVGCGILFPVPYTLSISSTQGGAVTTPGEGTFTYFLWAQIDWVAVKLVAEADEGYRFVEWTGGGVADAYDAITEFRMDHRDWAITANFGPECIPMVAAGGNHTVGLKDNGRVFAVGDNSHGQCNVGSWKGITQVAAGYAHTVGLRSDGTVVAVGDNQEGQCNVAGWTNITQVDPGMWHTVGLKSDGTVVDTTFNVGNWTNIVQVSAGYARTVGVKADGNVVAVGDNQYGQCDFGVWMLTSQVSTSFDAVFAKVLAGYRLKSRMETRQKVLRTHHGNTVS